MRKGCPSVRRRPRIRPTSSRSRDTEFLLGARKLRPGSASSWELLKPECSSTKRESARRLVMYGFGPQMPFACAGRGADRSGEGNGQRNRIRRSPRGWPKRRNILRRGLQAGARWSSEKAIIEDGQEAGSSSPSGGGPLDQWKPAICGRVGAGSESTAQHRVSPRKQAPNPLCDALLRLPVPLLRARKMHFLLTCPLRGGGFPGGVSARWDEFSSSSPPDPDRQDEADPDHPCSARDFWNPGHRFSLRWRRKAQTRGPIWICSSGGG